jgi:uncharacterized protein
MRLIVSDIPEDGLYMEDDLQITVREDSEKENARVSINVHKHGKRVLIKGMAGMSSLFTCSRCLKQFYLPLSADFEEEYLPASEVSGAVEQELTAEELDSDFYRDNEINIEELIREQMLLSVPMKPLCKPGCRGICPKCGKDLNDGPCGCKEDEIDPRLMPLKKIKESLKYRKE